MSTPPQNLPASIASYDSVPYSISAFPQTAPDRLAVIANIFGLQPAPPQSCRVLELGCAAGGNLFPLALAHPNSHFIGIDLSKRQIDEGNALLNQLQLPNLQLLHLSITDITRDLGPFDYILAHGVYSWVPAFVQNKILEICRDHLTPTGIAYISYNTLPGWHTRGALRDLLLYHTRRTADSVERVRIVRQQLAHYEKIYSASTIPFHAILAKEIVILQKTPDSYIAHEYVEDFNEPLHFHQFIARAAEKDLQFLAEAEIATMLPARFGPEIEKALRESSPDPLALEQAMDFLRNRTFRQSLLCQQSITLNRTPNPHAVTNFHIASAMKPESPSPDIHSDKPESFIDSASPKLTTKTPLLKAALVLLSRHHPLPIHFTVLLAEIQTLLKISNPEDAGELAEAFLNCYTAGIVEFTLSPPRFTTTVAFRPATCPYIRLRAKLGLEVTNLRLDNIALTEPSRLVLTHLDGSHDRQSLIALVTALFNELPPLASAKRLTESNAQRAARYIDYILPTFAQSALLIA